MSRNYSKKGIRDILIECEPRRIALISLLVVGALVYVVPCHAIWDLRDPHSVAEDAPVIVAGEIVKIDVAPAGDRVEDVAHIRILSVKKHVLSDVPLEGGGEILVRMHGKNRRTSISTDLRYELGTQAIWLIFLEGDGRFYINRRIEQRQPLSQLEKFYLRGTLRVRHGPYTKAEWLKRQKGNEVGEAELTVFDDRPTELRASVMAVIADLTDDAQPLDQRLTRAADQPFEVRRQVLNAVDNLLDRPRLRRSVFLYFLRTDKEVNMRTASASSLGGVKPMDQEIIDALTGAIENDEPNVKLFASQSLGFGSPAAKANLDAAYAALMRAVEDNDADEDLSVARTAARALGRRQHEPARELIIGFFAKNSKDPKAAWVCAQALSRIGGADDVVYRAVDVALTSKNWNIRHLAATALERLPAKTVVPFIVYHLADEMRQCIEDTRLHAVGDRPLRDLIRLLEQHTGEKFGTDVNAWVEWLQTNQSRYERYSDKAPRGVSQEVQQDYHWHMKVRGWGRCINTILAQKGKLRIDGAHLLGSLTYLDNNIDAAGSRQLKALGPCIEVLSDCLEHRDQWVLDDPSDGRIYSSGRPGADELAFWMKRVASKARSRMAALTSPKDVGR